MSDSTKTKRRGRGPQASEGQEGVEPPAVNPEGNASPTPATDDDDPWWYESLLGADGLVHDTEVRNMEIGSTLQVLKVPQPANEPDMGKADGVSFAGTVGDLWDDQAQGSNVVELPVRPPSGETLERRIAGFWAWFERNQKKLLKIRLDARGGLSGRSMDMAAALADAASSIAKDLSIEIEDPGGDGRRRLVVSANGMEELFSLVHRIVDSAPRSRLWEFVKFRQRMAKPQALTLHGHVLRPQDLQFTITQHRSTGEFGLFVFIPGYDDAHREIWQHMAYIVLDMLLGEYDVAMKVRSVELLPFDLMQHVQRLSCFELAEAFDRLFASSLH